MADVIRLSGLRGFGHHGVLEDERRNGQEFVVDIEMAVDVSAAIAHDDVSATVHYGEVADVAIAIIEGDPHDLIETVAARVAEEVLAGFGRVERVTVVVHKPDAPIAHRFDDVAVQVTRRR